VEKCDSYNNGVGEILGFIQSENIAPDTYVEDSTIVAEDGTLNRIIPLIAGMFLVMIVPYSLFIFNDNEKTYAINDDYEMLLGSIFRSEKMDLLSPNIISDYYY